MAVLFYLVTFFLAISIYKLIRWNITYYQRKQIYGHLPVVKAQLFDYQSLPILFEIIPKSLHPIRKDQIWAGKWDFYSTFKEQWPFYAHISGTADKGRVFVADAEIIQEMVTTKRNEFLKPTEDYKVLDIFGRNVVTTEGGEWRRHRKITGPSFNERNNRLVHDVTRKVVVEMFEHWDRHYRLPLNSEGKSENPEAFKSFKVRVDKTMMRLALLVITEAAFNQKLDWEEDVKFEPKDGHKLSFQNALEVILKNTIWLILLPKWLLKFPFLKPLNLIDLAYNEFNQYMKDMKIERTKGFNDEKKEKEGESSITTKSAKQGDLFTTLLSALEDTDPQQPASPSDRNSSSNLKLTELEFFGNMFIFLVAGHETTGGTLTHALALLALNPEIQEKLYQHIISVLGDQHPTYDDFPKLTYSMYVMKETLRLYPSVVLIPKCTPKQASFNSPVPEGVAGESKTKNFTIPANTQVGINVPALHRNPKYWARPNEFIPERFDPASKIQNAVYKDSSNNHEEENDETNITDRQQQLVHHRHAFIPFSDGIRSCLGRKFAEVEFICALSMIIQSYTVHIPYGVNADTLLDCHTIISLKPKHPLPLLFKKRNKTAET